MKKIIYYVRYLSFLLNNARQNPGGKLEYVGTQLCSQNLVSNESQVSIYALRRHAFALVPQFFLCLALVFVYMIYSREKLEMLNAITELVKPSVIQASMFIVNALFQFYNHLCFVIHSKTSVP